MINPSHYFTQLKYPVRQQPERPTILFSKSGTKFFKTEETPEDTNKPIQSEKKNKSDGYGKRIRNNKGLRFSLATLALLSTGGVSSFLLSGNASVPDSSNIEGISAVMGNNSKIISPELAEDTPLSEAEMLNLNNSDPNESVMQRAPMTFEEVIHSTDLNTQLYNRELTYNNHSSHSDQLYKNNVAYLFFTALSSDPNSEIRDDYLTHELRKIYPADPRILTNEEEIILQALENGQMSTFHKEVLLRYLSSAPGTFIEKSINYYNLFLNDNQIDKNEQAITSWVIASEDIISAQFENLSTYYSLRGAVSFAFSSAHQSNLQPNTSEFNQHIKDYVANYNNLDP